MKKILYIATVLLTGIACGGRGGHRHGTADSLPLKNDSISATMPANNYVPTDNEDSFIIDNQQFRVVRDTSHSGMLEQVVDGKWKTILTFDMLGMQQWYDYKQDANADGYNDFIFHQNRHNTVVYMYDPTEKTLSDSALDGECCYWNWHLLDTSQKIFYDMHSTVMTGYDYSRLFTYKGLTPYYYYRLEFDVDKNGDDGPTVKSIELYRCNNGDESNTTFVQKIPLTSHDIGAFDYKGYWENNYKELLNLQ